MNEIMNTFRCLNVDRNLLKCMNKEMKKRNIHESKKFQVNNDDKGKKKQEKNT